MALGALRKCETQDRFRFVDEHQTRAFEKGCEGIFMKL